MAGVGGRSRADGRGEGERRPAALGLFDDR